MKIAFLNKYQNKVARGAETFVHELARRISKNHDVDIISDVNYFKLIKNRYDIIIPTNGRFQVIFTKIVSIISKSKIIISGQSGIGWDDRVNLYVFPNVFVALSQKALNWARKINPLVRSVYISNGVDLNKFTPQSGAVRNTILCVGALTEQKRIDLVIKAVALVHDVKLVIVGDGELKKEVTDLGNKLLPGRFEILHVPYEKMPEVYKNASLFTLVSQPSESFGNVFLEAMASNLAVVANDDPVRREIVGNAGLFVNPENVEAYAETLNKALNLEWGDLPRKQAEKFSWDKIAEEYEKLFINL